MLLSMNHNQYIVSQFHTKCSKTSSTICSHFCKICSNSISVGGSSFSIYLGTLDHVNTWVSGGTVTATSNGAVANVTNFVYDTANTGVAVVTTDTPLTLANDDIVRLADL